MNIAIIGLGEVGRCYAAALGTLAQDDVDAGSGVSVLLCEQRISGAAAALAESLAVRIEPAIGPWIQEADWVLSCVVGTQSFDVAQQCFASMRPGASFADLTTAAPEQKRRAADAAAEKQVGYADVAIMGAIFLLAAKTPLLCSGDAAASFATLIRRLGAHPRVLPDGRAGDAMALKILRSVFTKSMEAVAVEVLMAAEKQQLRQPLYDVLKDVDEASLPAFLEMLVTTHVIHAKRRLHEVEEAERQLHHIGQHSDVLGGVQKRFSRTADRLSDHPLPHEKPTLADALDWLSQQHQDAATATAS